MKLYQVSIVYDIGEIFELAVAETKEDAEEKIKKILIDQCCKIHIHEVSTVDGYRICLAREDKHERY